MKIWIINHYAIPIDGSGGTRHAVLGKYLQRLGHKVTIFASAVPHSTNEEVPVPEGRLFVDRDYDGVLFRFLRTTPYSNSIQRYENMRSFARSVLRAVDDLSAPDVVIGSCVHLHAAIAGLKLARRFQTPFIFEIRDIWPESLVDIGALSRFHPVCWLMRRMELTLYRNADAIIGLQPGMMPYLEKHGVPAEKFLYIPNGIDPVLYSDPAQPPSDGPFTFTYWGSHGPVNGLESLIRAAQMLRDSPEAGDIRLSLIGNGPAKESLRRMAAELGVGNVEFLPAVPKGALVEYANNSHAFISNHSYLRVIARYGISANKLFDYLMAARPIIFAADSYNDPVAEAGAGISIPPDDPEKLADAMLKIRLLTAEERRQMGERGRAWVLEHHNFQALAGELADRLQLLAGRSHAKGVFAQ